MTAVRNIEIIGDALSRILKREETILISNVRKIVDTLNRIIHGYDAVSDDVMGYSYSTSSNFTNRNSSIIRRVEIPSPRLLSIHISSASVRCLMNSLLQSLRYVIIKFPIKDKTSKYCLLKNKC